MSRFKKGAFVKSSTLRRLEGLEKAREARASKNKHGKCNFKQLLCEVPALCWCIYTDL